MTLKILMNSLYGALGNRHFPLFNPEIARAITGNGRYFIRSLSNHIESVFQSIIPSDSSYILYNDTDSAYFTVNPFVQSFLSKNEGASISDCIDFCQDLEDKLLNKTIQDHIDSYSRELNAYSKDLMGASREVISDCAVLVAKKKYYMRVRDDEGKRLPIDRPEYKVQGMDIIKGGTPQFSKTNLMAAIPEILDRDEISIREYVKEKKAEYLSHSLSDISQTQGVSRVDYVLGERGVPQGSRSAIVYNNYLDQNNLGDQYNPINGGDRIKKVFLLEPNKFGSDIVAFVDDNFEKEIETEIIDYDTMFEKGFLNMLKLMTDPIGWNITQETEVLDDW